MASSSRSPLLSCSVFHMFSYSSASFSDNGTSIKYSLAAALEVYFRDLQTLHIIFHVASVRVYMNQHTILFTPLILF